MVLVELISSLVTLIVSILFIYYKFVICNFWRKRGIELMVPIDITTLTGKMQFGVFLQDVYMKHKDHRAFGIYVFFKPMLVIADLDLIRTILTKEFESFHDRGICFNEKINPLLDNLFSTSGKRWRNMRVKLTPTFTSGKIRQMFLIMKEYSEGLAKYLESKAQMRNSIEMKDLVARYSMDVVMSAAFGIESNCIEDPNNEYQVQGESFFKIKTMWFILYYFVPQIMDFFSIPFMDRHLTNFYMNMFRKNVEYRQSHNIVRLDFMNLLIQLMEKGYVDPEDNKKTSDVTSTVKKLTMTEATAQSIVFFLAGFETSSSTATFALYELAQHQDIQDKVRKEIDETLAKYGDLTYEAINEMTYLHKVMKETLRKYPPLPMLNRICTNEINLPTTNIHLPKGTLITISVLGVHRDPSIYSDPDKFDPERFNADEMAKRHPYAYLPFGGGPRMCIGARFGSIQTKVVLVSLLSKYKFKLDSKTAVPITFNEKSIVLAAKGGIHLIIEPRKNNCAPV